MIPSCAFCPGRTRSLKTHHRCLLPGTNLRWWSLHVHKLLRSPILSRDEAPESGVGQFIRFQGANFEVWCTWCWLCFAMHICKWNIIYILYIIYIGLKIPKAKSLLCIPKVYPPWVGPQHLQHLGAIWFVWQPHLGPPICHCKCNRRPSGLRTFCKFAGALATPVLRESPEKPSSSTVSLGTAGVVKWLNP